MTKPTRWLLVALVVAGCASREIAYDQMLPDEVLALGMAELQEGDWSAAVEALEYFVFQFPTHARQPEARYRLGEAHFGDEDFILAANEFSRLADDYPAGPWADDARFMVCRSYRELSPRPQLDQEYTTGAIDHCNSLIAYYPDSEYVPQAREIVQEMTDKLALKGYREGEFYFSRRAYDPAVQVLEMVLERYPASTHTPGVLLKLYEAYSKLGYDAEATATRERLLRDFPDSAEARQLAGGTAAVGA